MPRIDPCMVAHSYNLHTWEAEAEGSWIQGQPGLYSKTLCQQTKEPSNKVNKKCTLMI
jgi:hypothetical protein